MYIAPYWARARMDTDGQRDPDGVATAFGWSFDSQEEAEAHAIERAKNMAKRLRMLEDYDALQTDEGFARWKQLAPENVRDQVDWGGDFPWDYYGGTRPLREPIEAQFGGESPWGMVTRNRYGALVLNTASAMFIDLDLPPPAPDRRGFLDKWLWQVPPPPPPDPTLVVARARAVVAQHPGMGLRLYRTAAGFRGLLTHRGYDPEGSETLGLLGQFQSDPLYVQLCKAQRCFRARLTPKPWRLGLNAPPINWFPYQERPDRKQIWADWLQRYEQALAGVPVCEVVEHIGEDDAHPDIVPVIELHDGYTLGEGTLA